MDHVRECGALESGAVEVVLDEGADLTGRLRLLCRVLVQRHVELLPPNIGSHDSFSILFVDLLALDLWVCHSLYLFPFLLFRLLLLHNPESKLLSEKYALVSSLAIFWMTCVGICRSSWDIRSFRFLLALLFRFPATAFLPKDDYPGPYSFSISAIIDFFVSLILTSAGASLAFLTSGSICYYG